MLVEWEDRGKLLASYYITGLQKWWKKSMNGHSRKTRGRITDFQFPFSSKSIYVIVENRF